MLQTADVLDDLKLGNGTSILITANIASALPTSVGAAVQQATARDSSNLAVYVLALFLVTLGVVYVQARPSWGSQRLLCMLMCCMTCAGCVCTTAWCRQAAYPGFAMTRSAASHALSQRVPVSCRKQSARFP